MRKAVSTVIIAALLLCIPAAPAGAQRAVNLGDAIDATAALILDVVSNPGIGSTGGEWVILGLARSCYDVPDSYFEGYYISVADYIREAKGVLHSVKFTEYSRIIMSLTAAGFDPRNVAGYDLTAPLDDFQSTIKQGLNGPVFALLALDTAGYPNSQRENYLSEILRRQLNDGGWSLSGGSTESTKNVPADPDATGMVLQALAKYSGVPEVSAAIDRGLNRLSAMQNERGGYSSWDNENIESSTQALVALCELGIPVDDARFVKNGNSLIDNILSYMNDNGSFRHSPGDGGDTQMSTEQGLYGLVAAWRAESGMNSLYRMDDAAPRHDFQDSLRDPQPGQGLPGKNPSVSAVAVKHSGKTFPDIADHPGRAKIEALAERGVINGKSDSVFAPDAAMTRAEFAAITARALGLVADPQFAQSIGGFEDVHPEDWHYAYIATTTSYGITKGVSDTRFNPSGVITRQEAAVMVARSAALCGIETKRSDVQIRNTLAPFGDYRTVAQWAGESLAFCYDTGILDSEGFDIKPAEAILRCEVADMLYRLLESANLID